MFLYIPHKRNIKRTKQLLKIYIQTVILLLLRCWDLKQRLSYHLCSEKTELFICVVYLFRVKRRCTLYQVKFYDFTPELITPSRMHELPWTRINYTLGSP